MVIKRFNINEDMEKVEDFLREQFFKNKNMTSWLPERLHDDVYRMDIQLQDEGKEKSSDYFFLWIESVLHLFSPFICVQNPDRKKVCFP